MRHCSPTWQPRSFRLLAVLTFAVTLAACNSTRIGLDPLPRAVDPFIEELQGRTFRFFWETTNPQNGLTPDRWPTPSFSSIAAVGFALTSYPIGIERGWVTRAQAAERVHTTLRFFRDAPQGPEPTGVAGYKGFYYHFLNMQTGHRFQTVELSTIDTALMLAGALFCREYFDGDDATEREIREMADSLYARVEWTWIQPRPPAVSMGWHPESGFIAYDYDGYNEAMLLYILALGSPTHPIDAAAWPEYTSTYRWGSFLGYEHLNFAPLFGHQFSHVWIDFRGIRDAYMRERGIDYFENSRRATLAQRAYAIENPMRWRGYGATLWGLTASDGPADVTLTYEGEQRQFWTYTARGAALGEIRDDGTLVPTAVGGSVPFAPEVALPALRAMHDRYGEHLYGQYGFLDAFNPSFQWTNVPLQHGTVVPDVGWFDGDYLGIDQGPIVTMIENHRTELVWQYMRKNEAIVRGLKRAGFSGGWLDSAAGQ